MTGRFFFFHHSSALWLKIPKHEGWIRHHSYLYTHRWKKTKRRNALTYNLNASWLPYFSISKQKYTVKSQCCINTLSWFHLTLSVWTGTSFLFIQQFSRVLFTSDNNLITMTWIIRITAIHFQQKCEQLHEINRTGNPVQFFIYIFWWWKFTRNGQYDNTFLFIYLFFWMMQKWSNKAMLWHSLTWKRVMVGPWWFSGYPHSQRARNALYFVWHSQITCNVWLGVCLCLASHPRCPLPALRPEVIG